MGKKVIIELPYALPLWNSLLCMNHWQRKKVRDLIHQSISALQATESENTTLTVYRLKPSWMALYNEEYYKTIRPSRSKASRSKASSARKRKR